MTAKTYDSIVAMLAGLLADFQGREYSGEIGPDTLFFGDLGFVSIDAVVLGETLEDRFGRKLAFNKFLSELGAKGAQDIEVGELARFLSEQPT